MARKSSARPLSTSLAFRKKARQGGAATSPRTRRDAAAHDAGCHAASRNRTRKGVAILAFVVATLCAAVADAREALERRVTELEARSKGP